MGNPDRHEDATRVGPEAGSTASESVTGTSLAKSSETSAMVLAQQARAKIEVRAAMAYKRPRDIDAVRNSLLKECMRQGFARSARYSKPAGGGQKVQGFTIRFAEAAVRCATNITSENYIVSETDDRRIIRVEVSDLESNTVFSNDVSVDKTVERSKADGREVLGTRKNSYGGFTYIVRATEDEMVNKQASAISKAIRNSALRLIPGDILDDCLEAIAQTNERGDEQDPDAARKALFDSFSGIGIQPAALKDYLGHDGSALSKGERTELREVYVALKDGEARWSELLSAKKSEREVDKPKVEGPSATDKAREAAMKAAEKAKAGRTKVTLAETKPEIVVEATSDAEPNWAEGRQ